MPVTVPVPVPGLLGALVVVVVVAVPTTSCSVCSTCTECQSDPDCGSGSVCNDIVGICEPLCDSHDDCGAATRCDFSSSACVGGDDACTTDAHCNDFFVCDFTERLCIRETCELTADCDNPTNARCDEDGLCVSPGR